MKTHTQLLIALVAGALLGTLFHSQSETAFFTQLSSSLLAPIGQAFLRLIFMIVVPMVFSSLILGVYELARGHDLGKVVSKTFLYTFIASSSSVFIGILLVNVFRPGDGLDLPKVGVAASDNVEQLKAHAANAKPFTQAVVELIPKNPLESAVRALDGEMISLMVFALIFGVALSMGVRKSGRKSSFVALMEEVFAACLRIVHVVMKFAPLAVFALVFNTSLKFGYGLMLSLLFYVVIVVVGLLIQQFVVYSSMLKVIGGVSPLKFFRDCSEVYLYAFATASSNATLPLALETAEKKLLLPPQISRFVLTVGSTANQNGTALFEGVTVLFLAQVYGIELSVAQQIQVCLMSILAGIGTAGVPGGSLPLIMILLQQVGIPAEGMGIILGVDRLLDMCRTTLNVSGDLVIATLVGSRAEIES